MTMALEGAEGSASRPGRSLPPGKTRYPLCRRLGGPQGRSGQVRKISFPPGFDPRTVQPVASRYTDYATRPTYRKRTGLLTKKHDDIYYRPLLSLTHISHLYVDFISKLVIIKRHLHNYVGRTQNKGSAVSKGL